ncbi:iron complex transport system permease protein [Desulfurobacterium pacificum]|uniref:Iron complex transport system permease protein n=1 Tax=Desulfurobacterium pacificum TaxID=240166 RepID=A0ABY1NKJ1_9BACT|nr:iron ABC transporter permease [Desulfurobacterium pacificum]SMP11801.1 iron complex transport system permease protein [Desulfurobacterium pacificum]
MRFKITIAFLLILTIAVFLLFLGWKLNDERVLMWLRLPEALVAFSFGGVLGITGVVYQGVLKNPLASPYILGVSAGAAFGATVAAFFSFPVISGAILGSLVTVFLLVLFSAVYRTSAEILLFGVGINAFLSSLILFLYAVMPSFTVQDALFFTLGFISPQPLKFSALLFLISLLAIFVLLPFGKWVDALSLGELGVFSGVRFEREGIILLILSALFVSVFVGTVGIVGFVGIVVPHIGRLLGFRVSNYLMPVSFLVGGVLLLFSQFLARTLVYPTVLPVGAITAVVGVPLFLYVLWRAGRA